MGSESLASSSQGGWRQRDTREPALALAEMQQAWQQMGKAERKQGRLQRSSGDGDGGGDDDLMSKKGAAIHVVPMPMSYPLAAPPSAGAWRDTERSSRGTLVPTKCGGGSESCRGGTGRNCFDVNQIFGGGLAYGLKG
jgi:hypothetical protein